MVFKPAREGTYYIVTEEILPEAIIKTAKIKELLAKSKKMTINEAAQRTGLSRSAYYKYKDGVFPFYEGTNQKIVTLSLALTDQSGVLSSCLNSIAKKQANVLTINQSLPLQGMAHVVISIDTKSMKGSLENLIASLGNISGVLSIEIIGQS